MITPEQVEKALLSWSFHEYGSPLDMRRDLANVFWSELPGNPDPYIISLARHIATTLNAEPVRIEVKPGPPGASTVAEWNGA